MGSKHAVHMWKPHSTCQTMRQVPLDGDVHMYLNLPQDFASILSAKATKKHSMDRQQKCPTGTLRFPASQNAIDGRGQAKI